MIYRPQRGGLTEAMKDAVVIYPATRAALAKYLNVDEVRDLNLVDMRCPDERIGWANTYRVICKGWAVGYTDTGV